MIFFTIFGWLFDGKIKIKVSACIFEITYYYENPPVSLFRLQKLFWKPSVIVNVLHTEPVFVNLLRSPEIDSQPGGPVLQPCLTCRPAKLHRLAESIPWNWFLGSLNVYKFGEKIEKWQRRKTGTDRYSYEAFGTISKISTGILIEASRNFLIIFSFTIEPENLKTLCACTNRTALI